MKSKLLVNNTFNSKNYLDAEKVVVVFLASSFLRIWYSFKLISTDRQILGCNLLTRVNTQ